MVFVCRYAVCEHGLLSLVLTRFPCVARSARRESPGRGSSKSRASLLPAAAAALSRTRCRLGRACLLCMCCVSCVCVCVREFAPSARTAPAPRVPLKHTCMIVCSTGGQCFWFSHSHALPLPSTACLLCTTVSQTEGDTRRRQTTEPKVSPDSLPRVPALCSTSSSFSCSDSPSSWSDACS